MKVRIQPRSDKRVGDLTNDAKACLADLLQSEILRTDCWCIKLAVERQAYPWELLTNDSTTNDTIIRDKIARSHGPITDLVLAFVGEVEWRGSKSLMAYMQYFRTGYQTGLLCGSHLRRAAPSEKLVAYGGFLILGGCQNVWLRG